MSHHTIDDKVLQLALKKSLETQKPFCQFCNIEADNADELIIHQLNQCQMIEQRDISPKRRKEDKHCAKPAFDEGGAVTKKKKSKYGMRSSSRINKIPPSSPEEKEERGLKRTVDECYGNKVSLEGTQIDGEVNRGGEAGNMKRDVLYNKLDENLVGGLIDKENKED